MAEKQQLYPMLLEPVYKDYVWGGDRIARRYNRAVTGNVVAESWEVADRPEGMSIVSNGPLAGKTLGELVRSHGADLFGHGRQFDAFPLLIKIIDARQRLSLQVHPDELSAGQAGGEPKTEAWMVLDAEPNASVYAGFKRTSNEAEFRRALEEGNAEALLRPVSARRGDVIYIPGGRVHCIGEGCLLLEIQQNSNTTYRVYDWGRVGHDGKPRELHLEQALRVIRWNDTGPDGTGDANGNTPADRPGRGFKELLRSPFFLIEKSEPVEEMSCSTNGHGFHILFVESGYVRIHSEGSQVDAGAGTSVLVPASTDEYRLSGAGAAVIRVSLD